MRCLTPTWSGRAATPSPTAVRKVGGPAPRETPFVRATLCGLRAPPQVVKQLRGHAGCLAGAVPGVLEPVQVVCGFVEDLLAA